MCYNIYENFETHPWVLQSWISLSILNFPLLDASKMSFLPWMPQSWISLSKCLFEAFYDRTLMHPGMEIWLWIVGIHFWDYTATDSNDLAYSLDALLRYLRREIRFWGVLGGKFEFETSLVSNFVSEASYEGNLTFKAFRQGNSLLRHWGRDKVRYDLLKLIQFPSNPKGE